MLLLKMLDFEQKLQEPDDIRFVRIAGDGVNLFTETPVQAKSLGIPGISFPREYYPDSIANVQVRNFDVPSINWNQDSLSLTINAPREQTLRGQAALFGALHVSEFLRQRQGRVLTHGAGLISPSGKGIVLLGNQGAGKTSSAILLGQNGFSLVGNDQIIFGETDNGISLIEGTKYITLRETIRNLHLPLVDSLQFKERITNKWDNKVVVSADDLGILEATSSAPIYGIFLIHINAAQDEQSGVIRIDPKSVQTNLFLAEKLSRHITGSAIPLLGDNGELLALSPSLDTQETLEKRYSLIKQLFEIGIYKVWGNNPLDIVEKINAILDNT